MASIDPTSLVGNVIKLNPLNSTSNTTTSATDTNAFAQMLAQEILSGDLTGLPTATNANTNSNNALMSSLLGNSSTDPLSSLLSGSGLDSSLLGGSSLDSSLLGGTSSLFGSQSSSLLGLIMGSSGTPSTSSMADLLSAELTGSLPYVSSMPLGSIGSVYAASATPTTTSTQTALPAAVTTPLPTSTSTTTMPTQATIQNWIASLAPQYNLDPKLVDAVVNQESGYSPNATSSVGAMGLMQLMPATAAGLGVTNPYDPVQNLKGGMTYLRQLLTRYNNNVSLALAAYNAGPNAVDSYNGIPPYPETQNYVSSIMRSLHTSTS